MDSSRLQPWTPPCLGQISSRLRGVVPTRTGGLLLTELVEVFTGRVLLGTLAYIRVISTGTGTRFPRVLGHRRVGVFKGP